MFGGYECCELPHVLELHAFAYGSEQHIEYAPSIGRLGGVGVSRGFALCYGIYLVVPDWGISDTSFIHLDHYLDAQYDQLGLIIEGLPKSAICVAFRKKYFIAPDRMPGIPQKRFNSFAEFCSAGGLSCVIDVEIETAGTQFALTFDGNGLVVAWDDQNKLASAVYDLARAIQIVRRNGASTIVHAQSFNSPGLTMNIPLVTMK